MSERRRGCIRSRVWGLQPLTRERQVAGERVVEDLLRQQLGLPQADIVIEAPPPSTSLLLILSVQ